MCYYCSLIQIRSSKRNLCFQRKLRPPWAKARQTQLSSCLPASKETGGCCWSTTCIRTATLASLLLQSLSECWEVVSSNNFGRQPPTAVRATSPAPSWQHQNTCPGLPSLWKAAPSLSSHPRDKGLLQGGASNGECRCKCRYSGLLSQGTGRGTDWPKSKRRKPFLSLWRYSEHYQLTFLTENRPSPAISSSPLWPTGQFLHHFWALLIPSCSSHRPSELLKSLHSPLCQTPKASSHPQPHIYLSLTLPDLVSPKRPNTSKETLQVSTEN